MGCKTTQSIIHYFEKKILCVCMCVWLVCMSVSVPNNVRNKFGQLSGKY